MIDIRHTQCGGQVGWYTGGEDDNVVRSSGFIRLDGTHPEFGERFAEVCPACGQKISAMELKRCFGEPATNPTKPANN